MSDYNGWTNYPTWCVNQWLNNESFAYHALRDERVSCILDTEDEDQTDEQNHGDAVRAFEENLREWVEDNFQLPASGLAGDLIGSALSEVNWFQIAKSWIEEE